MAIALNAELEAWLFYDELQVAAPFLAAEMIMNTENAQTKNLNFGEAMEYLKTGRSVIRDGWNGKGMCLTAQFPDENSKMTHPYLFMTIPDCDEGIRKLPWQPAQVDIFSNDWSVLDT